MSRAQGSGILALLGDYRHFAKGRLWLAFALMLAGAMAEGFGLLMIVPLATIALRGNSELIVYAPWAAGWSDEQRFAVALALFLGAMMLRSLLLFGRDVLLATLRAEYEADLRLRATATLASRGWAFASGIGQAGMQSLLLNDVPRAGETAAYLQQIALNAAMIAVQLALAFMLSPSLTLIACLLLAAGWSVSLHFGRGRAMRSGLAIVDAMESSADSGFRLHAGLKAALAQGTVSAFLEEYRSSLSKMTGQLTSFTRDYSAVQQMAGIGAACAAALLLFVGFRLLELPFPVLIGSLVLFARMISPAQALQSSAIHAAASAPSFGAILQRLGKLDGRLGPAGQAQRFEWNELRVDSVSYKHRPGLGVNGPSLALRPGNWLGIDGPSGSGKTTLLDLVAGLLPPQSGQISVDGKPLDGEVLDGWRAALSYVGQEGNVFNDSIRANLLAEGVTATDPGLWRVLEITGLDARIRAFDSGLDESVGDRGNHLSGGERQRLVLARALLRRPTLLILDEATAALDPAGEGEVLQRIRALVPRPAALIVAHRESTLRHCDSRLSLQHGQAVPVALRK